VTRVAIGLGCDRGVSLATLAAAVKGALAAAGLDLAAVAVAATIDKKGDEPGLLALARGYGWPLRFFSAEALSQVGVPTPSEAVRRHMGTPTVAEAAAILAGNGQPGDLLLPKYKHQGRDGKNATVAIARMGPHA